MAAERDGARSSRTPPTASESAQGRGQSTNDGRDERTDVEAERGRCGGAPCVQRARAFSAKGVGSETRAPRGVVEDPARRFPKHPVNEGDRVSTKVQPANDAGNEAWQLVAAALLAGDQTATIEAVRGIVDFDSAPSPVWGAAVRSFALAIESEDWDGIALPMWHFLRALTAVAVGFESEGGTATDDAERRAFSFFDGVVFCADQVLPDAARDERKAALEASRPDRPLNEREWIAADLAMQCERQANALLELSGKLQDEIGASVYLDGEVSEKTIEQARALLPKPIDQGEIVLAVRDLANELGSTVAENERRAMDAMIALMLRLGLHRQSGDDAVPVHQLLGAARAHKGLGGSWYVETMKLCVALGVMDASALDGLDDPKRRETMPAYKNFKSNASKWLSGKRGASLSLVKR